MELEKQTEINNQKLLLFKKEFDALMQKHNIEIYEESSRIGYVQYFKLKDASFEFMIEISE